MSLRVTNLGAVLALACACRGTAHADERPRGTSVALLAGYGLQVDTIGASGNSAYGPAFGARWGGMLTRRLYLGGTFVAHTGSVQIASDPAGTNTYRGAYHQTYFGPEVGFDLRLGHVLVRPYVGAGALIAIGRTSVRSFRRDDDNVFVYAAPSLLAGVELGRWLFALDLRMPIVPQQQVGKWAPALFLVVATSP